MSMCYHLAARLLADQLAAKWYLKVDIAPK